MGHKKIFFAFLLFQALFFFVFFPVRVSALELEPAENNFLKMDSLADQDKLFEQKLGLKLVDGTVLKSKLKSTQTAVLNDAKEAVKFIKRNVRSHFQSYHVPGLRQAVTRNAAGKTELCTGMVPQGICFALKGDYVLISAYCGCGLKHRSVIYVLDGKEKELLTTLVLDSSCHVGGIAAAGDYLWVCDSERMALRAYSVYQITPPVDKDYRYIRALSVSKIDQIPSFMCYANGYLYAGTFSTSALSNLITYYSLDGTEIQREGSFTIEDISCIQGISIRDDNMIITCSHGRNFSSQICIFRDTEGHFAQDERIYKSEDIRRIIYMPNMIEQCYIGSSYTYFLFESAATVYRNSLLTRPMDRFIRFKNEDMGLKKAKK